MNLEPLKIQAAEILTKKNDFTVTVDDLEFWAYPQTFGSTNPFGGGGSMMTTFTIISFRNTFEDDCVLFLMDRPQYHQRFKPMLRYKI